ncbi:acyltransferase family protein [Lentzea sp. NPDC054927]
MTRLPSLTGLRMIAACMVFVSHAAYFTGRPQLSFLYPLGSAGVSLFFILSGFVLTVSARDEDTVTAFWRRRVAKIYPSHVVAWAVIMLLVWQAGVPRSAPATLADDLQNLLLVQTLDPLHPSITGGNGVAWSLVCELVFYLLFPLLLPLARRIPGNRLMLAAGLAVLAVWLVPAATLALSGPPMGGPIGAELSAGQVSFAYLWPLSRLPEFVLGMIISRMRAPRLGMVAAGGLMVAALAVAPLLPAPFRLVAVTALPLALLIRATAAADQHARPSWLRTPVMVLLGDISYAFYLLHFTAFMAVFHFFGGATAVRIAAVFAITIVASWLLHRFVERPCMRLFATKRRRSQPEELVS